MRDRLVKFIATGFGIGYVPIAPGTAGAIVGIGFWWALHQLQHPWMRVVLLILSILLAVWIAGAASDLMHHPDPSSVIIDEIVAMPLVMIGLHAIWWQVLLGFAMFRLFDIWKPPPVREAEHFSGGLGIVLDDLLAAVYACAASHLVVYLVSRVRT